MEKLRALIIEDEPDNRQNLDLMVRNYCPSVLIVGEAANVAEGLEAIRQYQPDLIFLDVEMPDGNGFDLLDKVGNFDFQVIFVTAYSHYAIRAIKLNALDYILKPIDISELIKAVEKARNETGRKDMDKIQNLISNMGVRDLQAKRIPLASSDSLRMVELKDIIRLQGENNYTRFYFTDKTSFLVSRTIKDYAEMLEDFEFFRVHQSHVVNLKYVKSFVKTEGGYLMMEDGSEVGVARGRKNALLERLYEGA